VAENAFEPEMNRSLIGDFSWNTRTMRREATLDLGVASRRQIRRIEIGDIDVG
jgi:hypothetical protein